jgi:hypothetical protein
MLPSVTLFAFDEARPTPSRCKTKQLPNYVEIGNTMNPRIIIPALVAASVAGFSQAANAGGLFGEGGLIRGDVGNFLDRNLEQPVLTPMARNTVVGATTAVGTAVGGYVGGPTGAKLGGYAGGYVGDQINERAANQSPPIGRPARYPQQQQPAPYENGGSPQYHPYGAYASPQPTYAPPPVYVGAPPAYMGPQPTYAPPPVYVGAPPAYMGPRPIYVAPQPVYPPRVLPMPGPVWVR